MAGWPASLGVGQGRERKNAGGGGAGDGQKETCPQQTRKWPPGFWAVAVRGHAGSRHRLGWWGVGEGVEVDSKFQIIPPAQAIICTVPALSRGNGLDKGSAGVPAGARGLCIQVLAPRSKARPCAGPRLTSALQLHSFEAAQALTLCKPSRSWVLVKGGS